MMQYNSNMLMTEKEKPSTSSLKTTNSDTEDDNNFAIVGFSIGALAVVGLVIMIIKRNRAFQRKKEVFYASQLTDRSHLHDEYPYNEQV